MANTGDIQHCEKYPSEMDLIMSQTRYMNDHHHLFLLNPLAWYNFRDLRWKKVIIISDSTMNPLDDTPHLHKDVAHICMPSATVQQRAALLKMLQRRTKQINPIIILFGVMDHLDGNVDLQRHNACKSSLER